MTSTSSWAASRAASRASAGGCGGGRRRGRGGVVRSRAPSASAFSFLTPRTRLCRPVVRLSQPRVTVLRVRRRRRRPVTSSTTSSGRAGAGARSCRSRERTRREGVFQRPLGALLQRSEFA